MGAFCVKPELTQKPRWLRDLIRFLPLRSQFVLSGNVRDLQIHEPAPAQVTAAPVATILVDQLTRNSLAPTVPQAPGGAAIPMRRAYAVAAMGLISTA
jgi:hypothetical protein